MNFYQQTVRSYNLHRSNLVSNENGDLIADFHNVSKWENHFCHLLNVHMVSDVTQTEIHLRHYFLDLVFVRCGLQLNV
jgi:hypothetical protein